MTRPTAYTAPRRIERPIGSDTLVTCRGIHIGGAIAPKKPELGSHDEHLQAALLEPRTAIPPTALHRLLGAIWSFA